MSLGSQFAEYFEQGIRSMPYDDPSSRRKTKPPGSFQEIQLQTFLKSASLSGLLVNKKSGKLNRVDYQLVKDETVLATCELKGPARACLFNGHHKSHDRDDCKWLDVIKRDIKKQLRAEAENPKAEHYIAVLFEGWSTGEIEEPFKRHCLEPLQAELTVKLTPSCAELFLRDSPVVIVMVRVQKA
jgi:hypothetical protein